YQGDANGVGRQVEALYETLRGTGLVYVGSAIAYGNRPGQTIQRVLLPREALELKNVNCLDAAILMASLLEGIDLRAALGFVPGHAFVGWEAWIDSGEWRFLDIALIGSGSDFTSACQKGQARYEEWHTYYPKDLVVHYVANLRKQGILARE